MSKLVTNKTYQKLLKDITALYDQAIADVTSAVDSIFKKVYLEVGRLIVEFDQKGHGRAPYGKHLLESISEYLTQSNRKGFSVRNLRNMRQVYLTFPIRQLTAELTWTHYVVLSVIKERDEREAYEQKAIKNHWTVEELKEALYKGQVKTLLLEDKGKPFLAAPSKDVEIIRLAVKRGVPYTYRIVPKKKFFKDGKLRVDCGFYIYKELSSQETKGIKAGSFITGMKAPGSFRLKPLDKKIIQPKSILYTYKAFVERVIDGDTLVVHADLGFQLSSRQKLRLRKIDAPEIKTKAGQVTKRFLEIAFKTCPFIVIKTYSTDIFDRYLVDVFYTPGEEDCYKVASDGVYLNQELIDKGLADLWQRPDLNDLAFLN